MNTVNISGTSSVPATPTSYAKQQLHPVTQPGAENPLTRNDIWQWCLRADAVAPCYIRDVMVLRTSEQDVGKDSNIFWWLGTVPCRNVQFVGMVVGATAYERRTMYTVDDGTGAIQCVHPRTGFPQRKSTQQAGSTHEPPPPDIIPQPNYDIGDIVRISGRVEKWHDSFQIYVNKIELCAPNDEPDHWISVAKLHETYYTQPFIVPPLPPLPVTPVKPLSNASVYSTPSTITTVATPSTVASSSETATPAGGPVCLRHPSRLHSKDLISNTFKIYLKNYMDVLSNPLRTVSFNQDTATPKANADRGRPWQEEETPRPSHRRRKENATPPSRPRRQKGFTLSYLRRVPELAEMAFRVVDAEAKRRARELRRKQKDAVRAGKKKTSPDVKQTQTEPVSRKAKRLYVWAIRELYRDGSIILNEEGAPVWDLSAASDTCGVWKSRKTFEQSADGVDPAASSLPALEDNKKLKIDNHGELSDPPMYEESYIPLTPSLLAEPIMDSIKCMMVRKLDSRKGVVCQTGAYRTAGSQLVGPTAEELREYMGKVDGRWENVTEYAVADALQLLKSQDLIYKIGDGRWEITL